jgi:hypothetical protein
MSEMCDKVFVLGLDGMMGSAPRKTHTPHIDALLAEGVKTYAANTVLPSFSYQAWGAMFHGVGPEKHQIDEDHPASEDAPWPSFMKVARQTWPASELACFNAWAPIGSQIIEPSCACHTVSLKDRELVPAAAAYIREQDPKVFFMHLDCIDLAGHAHGYKSRGYLDQITETDGQVGIVLDAIRDVGAWERSLIVVLSDHGGVGDDHGSDHPDCMNIFWGCSGPGIVRGGELAGEVNIMDTASVVARALGMPAPAGWDARVPAGVFTA